MSYNYVQSNNNDPRYENHINAFPQTQKQPLAQQQYKNNTKKIPYPIDDSNEAINHRVPVTGSHFRTSQSKNVTPVHTPTGQTFNINSAQSSYMSTSSPYSEASEQMRTHHNMAPVIPQPTYNSSSQSFTSSNSSVTTATDQISNQKQFRPPLEKNPSKLAIERQMNLSNTTVNSKGSNTNSDTKADKYDLSTYSPEAIKFYQAYRRTIDDSPNFTNEVQFKWCEILFEYAFKNSFISQYNINAEKLRRTLTAEEVIKNQKIMIDHSFKVLSRLISNKYPEAIYLMGTLYSHQPYLKIKDKNIIDRDDKRAFELYKIASKFNHSDSFYRAGISYEFGRGVELDNANGSEREFLVKKAIECYEQGAMICHNQLCMYKLGMCYLYGLSNNINESTGQKIIEPDVRLAISWFEKSGNSQSVYELAKIYEFDNLSNALKRILIEFNIQRDVTKSLKYYYKGATKFNHSLSQWKLGYCYEVGDLNLPINGERSIAWYMKSIETNPNAMSMLSLGGWCLTGCPNILKANAQESFNWIYKSCEISDGKFSKAEFILGHYYENGIGCKQDIKKAIQRYEIACKLGHLRAKEKLRQYKITN